MSFWKVGNPAALVEWDKRKAEHIALIEECTEFCKRFNGVPVYIDTITDKSFYGIRFDGPIWKTPEIWTKQTGANRYCRTPRTSVNRAFRELSEELRREWSLNRPMTRVSSIPLYESLGYDWGNLLMSGFHMFRGLDAVYIETSAIPSEVGQATEILGATFRTASQAAHAENK